MWCASCQSIVKLAAGDGRIWNAELLGGPLTGQTNAREARVPAPLGRGKVLISLNAGATETATLLPLSRGRALLVFELALPGPGAAAGFSSVGKGALQRPPTPTPTANLGSPTRLLCEKIAPTANGAPLLNH